MELTNKKESWLDKPVFQDINFNWELLIFSIIIILAFVTRFYDLESRVMSHDETSHVYYSWRLSEGMEYAHTPLTHGPLQFHLVALSYFFFGDNDFTARIPAVLFSIATIAFLWQYRRYLGKIGTAVTAVLMLISPYFLYYGRYVRNEAFVGLFGLIMIWAILRYLETGEAKYTFWLTAVTLLHYATKETSFIYVAQGMLFLGLVFVNTSLKRSWKVPGAKNMFLVSLIVAFALLAATAGIGIFQASLPEVTAETPETAGASLANILLYISIGLSGISLVSALVFAFRGLTWAGLKEDRAFSLILLLGTMVLPQLAPLPIRMVGWDPLDYSNIGMLRTSAFLIPLLLLSVGIGLLWDPGIWLINAAIFYIPFTILFTTFFTNGAGFFSGIVGSLGYWLEQQAVERGSQPWYYYMFLQVPIYEFLPALGSILAMVIAWIDHRKTRKTSAADSLEGATPEYTKLFIPLTGFWIITSFAAYTVAGEKMPWLTFHITLPMILAAGWGIGKLIESINWTHFKQRKGLVTLVLIIVFFISLSTALGLVLGSTPPFQGKELHQLNATSAFFAAVLTTIASGWGLVKLLPEWDLEQLGKVSILTILGFLALITARSAFRAAYINYDNATEYLVYAHMARGPKEALEQIEELSFRTENSLDMVVAYDDETTYPYWWYFRNYPNHKYYADAPTRELRDAPVILVGDNNFGKIEPVVGNAYYQFDYIRIWWPNQDYFGLTWERIRNAITNPDMRTAIYQIWMNRDYSKYAEVTGKDISLANWSPSDRMRLYIRKDVAAKVWNYGSSPTEASEFMADPYEGKAVDISSDINIGGNGTGPGQFEKPRNMAIAPDGTIYVADTGNHRIQHVTRDGEVLHVWGSFADIAAGDAPPGTFYEPWGIAVDSAGFVYVTDTWNHRVQKFTSTGEFVLEWGYFGQGENPQAYWGPRDIKIDQEGKIYITDTGNKRIVIFDAKGDFITEFGSAGLGSGEFDEPVGIAVQPDGSVYIADTWNMRVQYFIPDETGTLYFPANEWEITGWFGQSLDNKPFLEVDSNGNLLVSDPESYRILEFSPDGEFIRFWGDYGTDLNRFVLPTGLKSDPDGGIWVADSGNHRILHFNLPAIEPGSTELEPEE